MALFDSGNPVANVELSNTFNTWRIRTNQIITQAAGLSSNNVFSGTLNTFNAIQANTLTGDVTGNASTATTLATARAINGVNFDGSVAITVPGNFTDRTTDESGHAVFISTTATGNQSIHTNTNYRFNPSTAELSATNFNSTSDVNKKHNVETITGALQLVNTLRGVRFNWNHNDQVGIGVIAQEIEQCIPEVVVTSENGKSVQYGNLVAVLIEAIKELQFINNCNCINADVTQGNYSKDIGYVDTVVALGNTGPAKNINIHQGGVFTATLTEDCTFTFRYPIASGVSSFTLVITNDDTPNRTVSFNGGTFLFPSGAASLNRTTAANATDVWVFTTFDGGNTYVGNLAFKDIKV